MINKNISIHLQDFPNLDFIKNNEKLVIDMDLVRLICSTALSIRDQKNLRVRLPLQKLIIIGKNASRILDFKEIIADEINVKNIEIQEDIENFAENKLQINFKKIGAKYGAKVKEITAALKSNQWEKISDKEIKIAGINLVNDEFELKIIAKNQDDKKFATIPLPTNDFLVSLDIEITQELIEEGISRDIVRAIQQARKDSDLDVSDRINIQLFSPMQPIVEVIEKYSTFIREQVLANEIKIECDTSKIKDSSRFSFDSEIEDGKLFIGIV